MQSLEKHNLICSLIVVCCCMYNIMEQKLYPMTIQYILFTLCKLYGFGTKQMCLA